MRFIIVMLAFCWSVGCGSAPDTAEVDATARDPVSNTVASFDGVPIAYDVSGEGEGAVVLIHGWACDRTYWREQVAELGERYRVVAIDLAGHGDSGDEREVWSIESLARDVEAVVDDLALESFVLVGHSMGGQVALLVAASMPERSIGVIGVDTLHDFEWDLSDDEWRKFIAGFEKEFRSTCEEFVADFFLDTSPAALEAEIVADMCSTDPGPATALMRDYRNVDYADLTSRTRIRVRCINAALWPTKVETNRRYADFDAQIMEGVGHFPMLETPRAFNELLLQAIEELTSVRAVQTRPRGSLRGWPPTGAP